MLAHLAKNFSYILTVFLFNFSNFIGCGTSSYQTDSVIPDVFSSNFLLFILEFDVLYKILRLYFITYYLIFRIF